MVRKTKLSLSMNKANAIESGKYFAIPVITVST